MHYATIISISNYLLVISNQISIIEILLIKIKHILFTKETVSFKR